jgi:hypothetical protein
MLIGFGVFARPYINAESKLRTRSLELVGNQEVKLRAREMVRRRLSAARDASFATASVLRGAPQRRVGDRVRGGDV